MLRVAVIFHHIGPYHSARLSAAGKTLDLVGLEWFSRDGLAWGRAPEQEDFRRISLFGCATKPSPSRSALKSRLVAALDEIHPKVVAVNGWDNFGSAIALADGVRRSLPMVMMSESTVYDAARARWKEWIKRRIIGTCSTGLVGGRDHREYLVRLGMDADRIFLGYDAVDNEHFFQGASAARANAEEMRRKHVLPSDYFLASNRFVPKKNLPLLLRAYAAYRVQCRLGSGNQATPWDLVLLGDGPLRPEIESLVAELGLSNSVHLPGFRQYEQLPAYYGLAGAFVHASTTEQWGLVVNEAMASGLPVIVSNRCGCHRELVEEGKNGLLFDPLDEVALTNCLLQITADDARRVAMGHESRRRIQPWGPDRFARGLEAAAEAAMRVGPQRRRWSDRLLLRMLAAR